jgi:hypothetical protein
MTFGPENTFGKGRPRGQPLPVLNVSRTKAVRDAGDGATDLSCWLPDKLVQRLRPFTRSATAAE